MHEENYFLFFHNSFTSRKKKLNINFAYFYEHTFLIRRYCLS